MSIRDEYQPRNASETYLMLDADDIKTLVTARDICMANGAVSAQDELTYLLQHVALDTRTRGESK